MKKLLVIQSAPATPQLNQILKELSLNGLMVRLYTKEKGLSSDPNFKVRPFFGLAVLSNFWQFLIFTIWSPFFVIWWFFKCLILRTRGYSKVILTSLPEQILLTPWLKILGYKVIWTVTDYLPKKFQINIYSLFFRLWSRFVKVVPRSEAIHEYLISKFHLKDRFLTVIPPYIEENNDQGSIFESLADDEFKRKHNDFFIIGFVGKFDGDNGVDYLIKATEHFKQFIHSYQVVLVGDGVEKKNLLWLIKLMGLERQVRFVGNQIAISKWLEHFDVLVVPRTVPETFSQITLLAMNSGVPVIGCDVDGIKELISEQGGILVPPKQTEPLANAIFSLYQDQELYNKIATSSRARVKERYSKDAVMNKWKEVLGIK